MTELARPVALDRIGPHGMDITVEAGAAECAAIAVRLQIPAVTRLTGRFRLRRVDARIVAAEAELDAMVIQTCVVALEPFEQPVHETFALEFVPDGTESDNPDPDAVDQIPYGGRSIDLGEATVEQLALALDPYPRGPGAGPAGVEEDEAGNPFAALAAMRRRQ